MSHGTNTQLIHGLDPDPAQSRQLRQGIKAWLQTDEGLQLRSYMSDDDDLFTLVEMMGDEDEGSGIRVVLVSEDSDSRIHSTVYDEGRRHGFGILLADKGYGSCRPPGDFAKATQLGATDEHKAAYRDRLGGILKLAGLDALEPKSVVVSHTA